MVIHYVFISSFRNAFKNLGFNLGGKFHFKYDHLSGTLTARENPFYLANFFNSATADISYAKIENVAAIIGENGVGKTTFFDFLKENFSSGSEINTPIIIALTTNEGQLKLYHHSEVGLKTFSNNFGFEVIKLYDSISKYQVGGSQRIEIKKKPVIPEFQDVDFVYFSNIYDGKVESSLPGIKNISTNYLIHNDHIVDEYDREIPRWRSELDAHRTAEFGRQLDFINTSEYAEVISFPLPKRLVVSLANDLLGEAPQSNSDSANILLSQYDYSEFIDSFVSSAKKALLVVQNASTKVHIAFIVNAIVNRIFESVTHTRYYRVGFLSGYKFEAQGDFLSGVEHLLDKMIADVDKLNVVSEKSFPGFEDYPIESKQIRGLKSFHLFLARHLTQQNSAENSQYFVIENNDKNVIQEFFRIYRACIITDPFLNFEWGRLSTGERALLNLYSRFYAISNNAQPSKTKNENPITGSNLIILIDEGEIYLHPNWQKHFISYLLDFLPANFATVQRQPLIQIILASNSPFIASDLPSSNLAFLKKDERNMSLVQDSLEEKRQTFAANIHSLLSDGFFMKNGTVGDFAVTKINEILELLNGPLERIGSSEAQIEQKINLIGEPLIKSKLLQMLDDKIRSDGATIKSKIALLEQELSRLKRDNQLK